MLQSALKEVLDAFNAFYVATNVPHDGFGHLIFLFGTYCIPMLRGLVNSFSVNAW